MTVPQPAATGATHEHKYHALWSNLGPHGRQDIHYHPCTEAEPGECYAVLVSYGRDCNGDRETHVVSELPLPDDLVIPGEPSLDVPGSPVTGAAIKAALAARAHALIDRPTPTALSDEALTRQMLEAAAPFLVKAERERCDRATGLLREAMHLRVHGERAPGGDETWADWDRKAGAFLREQP